MAPKQKKLSEQDILAAENEKKLNMLRQKAAYLKSQCESEDRAFNEILEEREKINYFWIIEKQRLEGKKNELRLKKKETEDIEERHSIQLSTYKEKLKQLRFYQYDEIIKQQLVIQKAMKLLQDDNQNSINDAMDKNKEVKQQIFDKELSKDELIFAFQLYRDEKNLELRLEFERKIMDLEQIYKLKLSTLREEMEKESKEKLHQLEEKKKKQIHEVMSSQTDSLMAIKNYFFEKTSTSLDLIKRLKEDLDLLKKEETKGNSLLANCLKKNKLLLAPLTQLRTENVQLANQVNECKTLREERERLKEEVMVLEKSKGIFKLKYEVLFQQLDRINNLRNELNEKLDMAFQDVQQKAGLSNLILEKKIKALEKALEVADVQMNEFLVAAGLQQPTANNISEAMERTVAEKTNLFKDYSDRIARVRMAQEELVKQCENKLMEYAINPRSKGFEINLESDQDPHVIYTQ